MSDETPKIFIDEGWKAQVEREKEQAKQPAPEPTPESSEHSLEHEPEEIKGNPYFVNLVSGLAAQAMYALGMVQSDPNQRQVTVDLGHAQLLVETLLMIRDKTKGNLEPEEEGHLREIVAELQHLYAVRAQQVQEAALRNAKIDPNNLKGGPGGGMPGGIIT